MGTHVSGREFRGGEGAAATGGEDYRLEIRLGDPEGFAAVFGKAVTAMAWADLTRDFSALVVNLLRRYRLLGSIQSPGFGAWALDFEPEPGLLAPDMAEQLPVLEAALRRGVGALLRRNLGLATGSRQDFEVGIGRARSGAVICRRATAEPGPTRESLEALLVAGSLETCLQPIVRLEDGRLAGYEALTRGPEGSPLREADPLFEAARHLGLSPKVELASFLKACEWLPHLPESCLLSVNLGPELLLGPELRDLLQRRDLNPYRGRLVLELTEHLPLESLSALRQALNALGDPPPRLSLDDTGCGFFDLHTVEALRPEIVKLCITVVSRLERGEEVVRETRDVIARVRELGGEVLGEGVETAAQAEILRRCGAAYAQGFHFGRPRRAEDVLGVGAAPVPAPVPAKNTAP